jgi:hypothetical protein
VVWSGGLRESIWTCGYWKLLVRIRRRFQVQDAVDFRGSIPAAVNRIMNVDNECWDGERSNWS